jgi:hypothetical protein
MPDPAPSSDVDTRSTQQVINQFRKITDLKRQLVKSGKLNGDATPSQVLAQLRKEIPQDIFI